MVNLQTPVKGAEGRGWVRVKRSYALWGLIPFKNNEVHFLQLEKLSKGLTMYENVTGRNAVQCFAEAEILHRAPQKQLLPLLNPSPALGIQVPRSSRSLSIVPV